VQLVSGFISRSAAVAFIAKQTADVLPGVVQDTGKESGLHMADDLVWIRGTVVIYGYHQEGL
jgi:hypothetical protein